MIMPLGVRLPAVLIAFNNVAARMIEGQAHAALPGKGSSHRQPVLGSPFPR